MREVECCGVCHSYDGQRDAVTELSFRVRRGEVLALIGPNGAGKSTTLRILATLQQPDRGTVFWDGENAWSSRYALRPRIGFLGDGTALYPAMTAKDYLTFFAECYGQTARQAAERVAELLARFDLASKAGSRISALSKGMRQRLAIARTLVHSPELLLLDEPADGLDPLGRRELREILRQEARSGVGIVVSSHVLRELDGFVDSVALLQRGRVEVHGTIQEVIARYEVGRRVHEITVLHGLSRALEILRGHEGLIEDVSPTEGSEDAGVVRVRIHGDEERAARLLRALILADVEVSAMARLRTDLEDVYQSLGRDEVS